MPRKVTYPDIEDVRRLYDEGLSSLAIGRRYGIKKSTMLKWLHQQGFAFRPPGWRYNDLSATIVDLYQSGVSEKAVAERLGIERVVVRCRLLKAGVTPRNRSDAMYLRMSQTSPDERRHLTAAAHAAARGRIPREDEMASQAITRERTQKKVGNGERLFAQWLAGRGHVAILQKAVGRYNLDLAIPPVAVEIHVHPNDPLNRPRTRKRIEYLTDRGWHVLYVWIGKTHFLTEAAADDAIAFLQRAKGDKAVPGMYRVIRGSGKLVTEGRGDLD